MPQQNNTTRSTPKKIAVLGGGMAAIAAAYELLESGNDYDITVYQMGWRIGGKGASGRNMEPAKSLRVEEHGLHIWAGLYDNAFRIMRKCYGELGRAPDAPLATWRDAFKAQNFLVLEEYFKGQWYNWKFNLPTNDQLPGEPGASLFLPLHSYIEEALEMLYQFWREIHAPSSTVEAGEETAPPTETTPSGSPTGAPPMFDQGLFGLGRFLFRSFARHFAMSRMGWIKRLFLWVLGFIMKRLWKRVEPHIDQLHVRQFWILTNFSYGNVRGILENDILSQGFSVIDEYDYRQWLEQYLVDDQEITINSPIAWFLYDADFAYVNGDINTPNLSAGIALYTLIRLGLTSKGAFIWEMQAGMGDTVFSPFYEVMKRRGVKFKFFHKVKSLHLADDKESVASITVEKQVNLKQGIDDYNPLVTVKGLPCWPSAPLYDQLENGEALKQEGVDFESWCTRIDQAQDIELQHGRDFDTIVLGISLGSLPYICCDLIEANDRWQALVENVKTVRTQAMQLWLKPTAYELGWTLQGRPILDSQRDAPLTTWADMTHLLNREGWPALGDEYPLNIAYFCGPMRDEPLLTDTACGPKEDCQDMDQQAANAFAKETGRKFLAQRIGHIWPNSVTGSSQNGGFKWNLLVDDQPGSQTDEARFDFQYFRGNVQPSERYVMSVSGSTRFRIKPGESGFHNLVLAGDWTDNSFNAGSIEAATMSGMLASHAISQYPPLDQITGLNFGQPEEKA
ncbi:MAG: NAD(P)-binding protein [Chloroflexota bacterium]